MKRTGLFIFALIGLSAGAYAQRTTTTPRTVYVPQTVYQGPVIDYHYHDGTAILRNGVLLTGRFQYNGRSAFIYRAGSRAARQKIAFSRIRRLTLAGADTVVTDRADSTVFARLGTRFYRQLADGETMVLDRTFLVDEERGQVGSKLYVLDDNGDLLSFSSLQKLNDWFYEFQKRSGQNVADVFLNKKEIVKAVAHLNDK